MIWEIVSESLNGAILISGLVTVMMMLIESLNVSSHGDMLRRLARNKGGQVALATFLGAIPGCMGGYAAVSLYTHGAMSFGALIAMMIATCGDETFVMLAMFPDKAAVILIGIAVLALVAGMLTDRLVPAHALPKLNEQCDEVHGHAAEHCHNGKDRHKRHLGWQRAIMFIGIAAFIAALATGALGHGEEGHTHGGGLNLLSEEWMNILFAALAVIMLAILVRASDAFVEEQLWHHIVCRHFPRTFVWTFGVLIIIGVLTQAVDISGWIGDNTALMVILATLVGIIPQSGPHLIFVTLYASGVLPLPVLLASCISQNGHACLPLLAESPRSFILAKAINSTLALLVGFAAMLT